MAVVTRRYRRLNVTTAILAQRVQATASVNANFTNAIDINIDNGTADFAADLDEFMNSLGFVFDAALVAVDVEAHGSRHGGAGLDAIADATVAVAGLVTAADKTKLDGLGSGASQITLNFGCSNMSAGADTRFINSMGGFDDGGVAELTDHPTPVPRAFTALNFFVRHNAGPGSANTIVYALTKNGAATALTVTLAANAVAQASDLTHTVSYAQGDTISVRGVKAASITSGLVDVTGSVQMRLT